MHILYVRLCACPCAHPCECACIRTPEVRIYLRAGGICVVHGQRPVLARMLLCFHVLARSCSRTPIPAPLQNPSPMRYVMRQMELFVPCAGWVGLCAHSSKVEAFSCCCSYSCSWRHRQRTLTASTTTVLRISHPSPGVYHISPSARPGQCVRGGRRGNRQDDWTGRSSSG